MTEPSDAACEKAKSFTYIVTPSEIPGQWQAHCLECNIVCTSVVGDDSPFGALGHTMFEVARALDHGNELKPAEEEFWPKAVIHRDDWKKE